MTAAAQVLPEERDLGRALDLQGQRFGALVALSRVVGEERATRWLCECDCGRFALRTAGQLRQSQTLGQQPCCSVCLSALRWHHVAQHRTERASALRIVYEVTGSLYSDHYDEQFVEACLAEQGLAIEETPRTFPAPSDGGMLRLPGHGVHIHPISGMLWECLHCAKEFTEGFGCVSCVEPICSRCCEQHAEMGRTLASIGRDLGVGTERVRQIEAKALRKLRHPIRANILKEFLDGIVRPHVSLASDNLPVELLGPVTHCGANVRRSETGLIYCGRCGNTVAARGTRVDR